MNHIGSDLDDFLKEEGILEECTAAATKATRWIPPECLKWHHIPARMWKEEDMWLIEVPDLNACTQGYSKNHAYKMVIDMVKGLGFCYIDTSMGFSRREIMEWRPKIVQFKNGNLIIGSNDPIFMMLLVDEHKKAVKRGKEAADEEIKQKESS